MEEVKQAAPKATASPKQGGDWSAIYGEASKQIGRLIDKQSHILATREREEHATHNGKRVKKDQKEGPKVREGGVAPERGPKEQKKPKYYLGSSIAGERKFNAL